MLVEENKNNNPHQPDSLRVLIVKTSSMGDIIHTFPAISDAVRAIPDIRFDWVVEESFRIRAAGDLTDRCRRLEQAAWERLYPTVGEAEARCPLQRGHFIILQHYCSIIMV